MSYAARILVRFTPALGRLAARPRRTTTTPPASAPVRLSAPQHLARWWNGSAAGSALAGSLLLAAALPPWNLTILAVAALIPWLVLVERPNLPGRRPYGWLWLAGFLFWLGETHWLRYPHWGTVVGWFFLAAYLGCYLPGFVWLARAARHGRGWPLVVAAPVAWTALELVRGHLLTGFGLAMLAHTQARQTLLVQVADLAGAYGLSALIVLVAAALVADRTAWGRPWHRRPILAGLIVLAATLGYGAWSLTGDHSRGAVRAALVQGSIDTEVKADPNLRHDVYAHYLDLSDEVIDHQPPCDLIIWPETMFREPLYTWTDDARPPDGVAWTLADLYDTARRNESLLRSTARRLGTHWVVGVDVLDVGPGLLRHYNSAVSIDGRGNVRGRYDKHHPVMFGEYIPFARLFPSIYRLTPLGGGIEFGTRDDLVELPDSRWAVDVCYETILPQLIRRQVARHRAAGREPDGLINLTNSGYYYGANELDLHLACGIFRAVEMRKPLLISANCGISAVIDADGRVLAEGPKRAAAAVVAEVPLDCRTSLYSRLGDWPAGLCLAACGWVLVGNWRFPRAGRLCSAPGGSATG